MFRSIGHIKTMMRFFSPQLILQKSNGYFQRKLSFSDVPGGFGGLIPYRNPYNLWFSRGSGPHFVVSRGESLSSFTYESWSHESAQAHLRVLGHFGQGHFGLGRFGLDISATDVSASENAEGARFGQNHKLWVWDVCMHKCVMHFIIFWNQICMWILTVDSKMHDNKSMLFFIETGNHGVYYAAVNDYEIPV